MCGGGQMQKKKQAHDTTKQTQQQSKTLKVTDFWRIQIGLHSPQMNDWNEWLAN